MPITFGVLPISQDENAIAVNKVRYAGEIVAAVAADTEAIAEQACKLIKVNYIPLKEFLVIDESLNDVGENEKIHEYGNVIKSMIKREKQGEGVVEQV